MQNAASVVAAVSARSKPSVESNGRSVSDGTPMADIDRMVCFWLR
jgi:hypothetical protein